MSSRIVKKFISYSPNQLLRIFKTFLNENWDYEYMSRNPNTTSSIIKLAFENQIPHSAWDWYGLSSTIKNSINLIRENIDHWDWGVLSLFITFKEVKENLDLPWFWTAMSNNSSITFNDIIENLDLPKKCQKYNYSIKPSYFYDSTVDDWNWNFLTQNIDFKIIKENLNLPWILEMLNSNDSITLKDVEENPSFPWDWRRLQLNENVVRDMINNPKYSNFSWNWTWLSCNNAVSIDFIKKNINENWEWEELSRRSDIPIDFVKENINKPWYWSAISWNVANFKIVKENKWLKWVCNCCL